MITAAAFCEELHRRGVAFVTGVPCSFFNGPISPLERQPSGYVAAANEGAALAMAAGAELRGWPDPAGDEPQHAAMGPAGHRLLDVLGVPHWTLEPYIDSLRDLLDRVDQARAAGRPAVVLVPKGSRRPATSAGS